MERFFFIPVLIAALLTLPVVALDGSDLDHPWRTVVTMLNWGTWLVFVAEVLVMLAVVDERRRWLRTHALDVALVLLTPPVFPSALQSLRALPLLRLLRVVRLAAIARRLISLEGLRFAAVAAVIIAIGGAAAFREVEREAHALSFADALWWAATTMTTVGYGDVTPETGLGRIVSVAVMLSGIGFIALLTGALAERFFTLNRSTPAASDTNADALADRLDALSSQLERIERRLDGR